MNNPGMSRVRVGLVFLIFLLLGAMTGWWLSRYGVRVNAVVLVIFGAVMLLPTNLIVKGVLDEFSKQVARFSDLSPSTGRSLATYLGQKRRELFAVWTIANVASAVSLLAGGWLGATGSVDSDVPRWVLVATYAIGAAALPGIARAVHYGSVVDRFATQVTDLIREPQLRADRLAKLGRPEEFAAMVREGGRR